MYREKSVQAGNPSFRAAACYVLAPVMCMYVSWVLQEAVSRGKRRLYFLARDGYLMYLTARILCEKQKLPIECRYLYCSRYAFRTAEYHLLGKDSLNYICLGGLRVTFEGVVRRSGLEAARAKEIAGLVGWEEGLDVPLSYRQLQALKLRLGECRPFMEMVEEQSRQRFPALCGYLCQEGLTDSTEWALVDSGWTGSMQKSLGRLLEAMGCKKQVEGYYFGMYEYPEDMPPRLYHTWYFSPETGLSRKARFSNNLFECIFSAPEGMTVGYVQQGGKYSPVLESAGGANGERIRALASFLLPYAERLGEVCGEGKACPGSPGLAFSLLSRFMGSPALGEAKIFGAYVFWDDVIGERNQRVASLLSPGELRRNHLIYKILCRLRGKTLKAEQSAWPEGSAVLAGKGSRRELWHCAACRCVLSLKKAKRRRKRWIIRTESDSTCL